MTTALPSSRTLTVGLTPRLRRRLMTAGAAGLALIGTLGVLRAGSAPAPSPGPLTVVATAPLAAGTPAERLASTIATIAVPATARPTGALRDLAAVRGLTLTHAVVAGQALRRADFSDPTVAPRRGVAGHAVAPGLVELTVSLSPERALGGRVATGDQVLVLATPQDDTRPASVLGPPITVSGVASPAGEGLEGPTQVTLAVEPALAPALAQAAARGGIWLAAVTAEATR